MLEQIRELSHTFIKKKWQEYRRYFIETHPMDHRLTIHLGERGVGKTTTLIQRLVDWSDQELTSEEILYVQADHFLVWHRSLYEIAEIFTSHGGKRIAFDEIHKYPNWSQELKSIYDTFPEVHVLASGSSALEIHKGSHDLSRRGLVYKMVGLSLREFIALKYGLSLSSLSLEEILNNHEQIAFELTTSMENEDLKILKLFNEYLEWGYYPFFQEMRSKEEYKLALEQNLHTTLEADLVAIYPHLTGNSIRKIKQLIVFITQAVPFTPNWQKIKQLTEIGDDRTLKTYFKYLEDAQVIRLLEENGVRLKRLETPEKILLSNSNQLFAYSSLSPNSGTVRETFFMNMLSLHYQVSATKETDCCIDQKYFFDVGGKNKNQKQIQALPNAYLALDQIEQGVGKRIPLWLFGFLY